MLTRLYVEALLVNPNAADQVWEAWDNGEFDDAIACTAWMMIAGRSVRRWPVGGSE